MKSFNELLFLSFVMFFSAFVAPNIKDALDKAAKRKGRNKNVIEIIVIVMAFLLILISLTIVDMIANF